MSVYDLYLLSRCKKSTINADSLMIRLIIGSIFMYGFSRMICKLFIQFKLNMLNIVVNFICEQFHLFMDITITITIFNRKYYREFATFIKMWRFLGMGIWAFYKNFIPENTHVFSPPNRPYLYRDLYLTKIVISRVSDF